MECPMTRGKDRSYTFLVNSGRYIRTNQHIRNKKICHRCLPKMHIDRKVIIINYCPFSYTVIIIETGNVIGYHTYKLYIS